MTDHSQYGSTQINYRRWHSDQMNFEALAEKAGYFKKDEKGVKKMCKMLEDMRNEAAREAAEEAAQEAALSTARENADRLIRKGQMSLEDIADCIPLLSLDDLKKMEAEIMSLV